MKEIAYSKGEKAKVRCYGADDVREGVAINHHEGVDVSITGNSTNPTRFQHPVAGTYKKECVEQGKKYFSVASGGGTGRTLHPDNMAAGPASYGMTDTMGRMHSDAQFAGSVLRARPRGDDGLPGHGQQPHGRRLRGRGRGAGAGAGKVVWRINRPCIQPWRSVPELFRSQPLWHASPCKTISPLLRSPHIHWSGARATPSTLTTMDPFWSGTDEVKYVQAPT